jgi:alpha/beta superfamily hydrolase
MDNKVVRTGRWFYYAGWTVVRFNFRGVGKSEGQTGNRVGGAGTMNSFALCARGANLFRWFFLWRLSNL